VVLAWKELRREGKKETALLSPSKKGRQQCFLYEMKREGGETKTPLGDRGGNRQHLWGKKKMTPLKTCQGGGGKKQEFALIPKGVRRDEKRGIPSTTKEDGRTRRLKPKKKRCEEGKKKKKVIPTKRNGIVFPEEGKSERSSNRKKMKKKGRTPIVKGVGERE